MVSETEDVGSQFEWYWNWLHVLLGLLWCLAQLLGPWLGW